MGKKNKKDGKKRGKEDDKGRDKGGVSDDDDGDEESEMKKWGEHAVQWKTFHTDEYNEVEQAEIDKQAAAFKEEVPNNLPTEAAKVIENELICRYVKDQEVLTELKPTKQKHLMAKCWGIRNQGLLRAALEAFNHENDQLHIRLWNELEDASERFTKGSYLYLSDEAKKNVKQDRFFGFRARLQNKYDWLHAYVLRQRDACIEHLKKLEMDDPMYKVQHRVRPSVAEKFQRANERKFLEAKAGTEDKLRDKLNKISCWNTYFGLASEEFEIKRGV